MLKTDKVPSPLQKLKSSKSTCHAIVKFDYGLNCFIEKESTKNVNVAHPTAKRCYSKCSWLFGVMNGVLNGPIYTRSSVRRNERNYAQELVSTNHLYPQLN
jgi:hypothetical protein